MTDNYQKPAKWGDSVWQMIRCREPGEKLFPHRVFHVADTNLTPIKNINSRKTPGE